MRNLLAFLFVLLIGVGVFGWFKGWYTISSQTDENGHKSFTLHTDPDKVESDLRVALAKSKDLIGQAEDRIKVLKDKASKAKGDQKSKLDQSIADLEAKRKSLQDELARTAGQKSDAVRKAIQHQIDELSRAIDDAASGH